MSTMHFIYTLSYHLAGRPPQTIKDPWGPRRWELWLTAENHKTLKAWGKMQKQHILKLQVHTTKQYLLKRSCEYLRISQIECGGALTPGQQSRGLQPGTNTQPGGAASWWSVLWGPGDTGEREGPQKETSSGWKVLWLEGLLYPSQRTMQITTIGILKHHSGILPLKLQHRCMGNWVGGTCPPKI